MESKVSYALVGLFVIALSLGLIGAILWLTSGTNDKTYQTYQVYVRESVAGLNPKAAVRYRGVDVGQVEDIRLDPQDPSRVVLTLQIEQGTPIRDNTYATLSIQGITGLATVELSGGGRDSLPLQAAADEAYPVIKSAPSLVKRLDDAFTDTVTKLEELSASMRKVLNPTNINAFGNTLQNLSDLTSTFAARADSIDRTLTNLEQLTGSLGGADSDLQRAFASAAATFDNSASASAELPPLLARLNKAADAAETMANTVSRTSQGLDQAVLESRRDLQRMVQRTAPEFTALLGELNRLSNSVQRFVNELDSNPQMLLLGKPAPRPGPGE